MAGNSIAKANVLIVADADQLHSGLNKAGADVQKWGKGVGKGMGGGKGDKDSGLAGMLGLGKIGGPAMVATAAVGGFVAVAKEAGDTLLDIQKQGDMAAALGLTSEQFTGMAGVAKSAGGDTKEFVESLVTMGNLGRDAAAGTEVASKAMADMGLNVDDFNKLRADEQFFKVFEALQALERGGKSTNGIMKAFGEDGGKILLPLLKKTPEELRKMADGFAISGEKMAKANLGADAIKEMKVSAGKLWQDIAIGMAPALKNFAEFAQKAIRFFKPIVEWWGRATAQINEIVMPVWDAISAAVQEAFDVVASWGDGWDWLPELPTIEETVVAVFRAIGIAAALAWDTIKMGGGIVAVVAGNIVQGFAHVVDAFESVVSLMKELPDELRPDGMDEFIAGTGKFRDDVRKVGEDMEKWGVGAVTGWGKSAEQFDKWLDKALVKSKKTGAAVAENVKGGPSGMEIKSDPLKLSGAIAAGTKEAYSMVIRNKYGITDDTAKKTEKNTDKTAKNTEKAAKELSEVKNFFFTMGTV